MPKLSTKSMETTLSCQYINFLVPEIVGFLICKYTHETDMYYVFMKMKKVQFFSFSVICF